MITVAPDLTRETTIKMAVQQLIHILDRGPRGRDD